MYTAFEISLHTTYVKFRFRYIFTKRKTPKRLVLQINIFHNSGIWYQSQVGISGTCHEAVDWRLDVVDKPTEALTPRLGIMQISLFVSNHSFSNFEVLCGWGPCNLGLLLCFPSLSILISVNLCRDIITFQSTCSIGWSTTGWKPKAKCHITGEPNR